MGSLPVDSSVPVVIVTGANSGVGYGTCKRLLLQLSQLHPPDTATKLNPDLRPWSGASSSPYVPAKGLRLIMACRSLSRANEARDSLLKEFEAAMQARKRSRSYDGHADVFLKNLRIECIVVDLCDIQSVFSFCADVKQRYPYISHLILNAGFGNFTGINWPCAIYTVLTGLPSAVTRPLFKNQAVSPMSKDNLGLVWQGNVFGHYIIVRELESCLQRSPFRCARVLWMSSLEAEPPGFVPPKTLFARVVPPEEHRLTIASDWQLTKTHFSYEGSKYEMAILGSVMDQNSRKKAAKGKDKGSAIVRHFVVHPGITASMIFAAWLGWFLSPFMLAAFYIARWLGSVHHPITLDKGAVAASHISLVDEHCLATLDDGGRLVQYGSRTTRTGREHVGIDVIRHWDASEGEFLLRKCEETYQDVKQRFRAT